MESSSTQPSSKREEKKHKRLTHISTAAAVRFPLRDLFHHASTRRGRNAATPGRCDAWTLRRLASPSPSPPGGRRVVGRHPQTDSCVEESTPRIAGRLGRCGSSLVGHTCLWRAENSRTTPLVGCRAVAGLIPAALQCGVCGFLPSWLLPLSRRSPHQADWQLRRAANVSADGRGLCWCMFRS